MTEHAPSPVFYASAKPEQVIPTTPEQPKAVSGVRKAVDKWLDRIGTKNVEKHFVEAHERVLATLDSNQRKEVFAQEADKWQKAGKRWGIAATVIDTALIGAGAGLAFMGWQKPEIGANLYTTFAGKIIDRLLPHQGNFAADSALSFMLKPFQASGMRVEENAWIVDKITLTDESADKIGKTIGISPAIASLGILFGSGPGHWLAHLAAGGKEKTGMMRAKTQNYVDSGKAAEHAAKVGNALGKAATETAKWAAEHPDEIRKTVETVSKVKKEHAESAQKIAQAKQKSADAKLDAEYADWVAHHPDKVYFEQSGTTPPSKAEYVELKAREAAAKKANKEAEERGVAKKSIFS